MPILYRILAAIGVAALLLGFGYYRGHANAVASLETKYAKELAASLEQSRETERQRQAVFDQTARTLTDEITRIASARDDLLKRLHDDPGRRNLPANPGTDCPRPDWRTLPAEMGAEIVRDIAKADEYREGLIGCYAALDALQ